MFVVSAYGLANCLVWAYYGFKVGLLTAEEARGDYLGLLVFIPLAGLAAFYFRKQVLKRQG
jgi:hypothetical protein